MLRRLQRDRRGVSVVTYALVLPLFIVVIFGILEIWRVMSIRQTLHMATYQAARALSSQGRQWLPTSAGQWEFLAAQQATYIVNHELEQNTLLPPGYSVHVQVEIEAAARGDLSPLGWTFTVQSQLVVPGMIRLEPINLGTLTLASSQVSYIEGLSGDWTPPEEGPAY